MRNVILFVTLAVCGYVLGDLLRILADELERRRNK